MPKKLTTNTKSLEAREKKAAVKKAKADEDEKRKEDGMKTKIFDFNVFIAISGRFIIEQSVTFSQRITTLYI